VVAVPPVHALVVLVMAVAPGAHAAQYLRPTAQCAVEGSIVAHAPHVVLEEIIPVAAPPFLALAGELVMAAALEAHVVQAAGPTVQWVVEALVLAHGPHVVLEGIVPAIAPPVVALAGGLVMAAALGVHAEQAAGPTAQWGVEAPLPARASYVVVEGIALVAAAPVHVLSGALVMATALEEHVVQAARPTPGQAVVAVVVDALTPVVVVLWTSLIRALLDLTAVPQSHPLLPMSTTIHSA